MTERPEVYCAGCGCTHSGDPATQAMLNGWDLLYGEKAYRSHDMVLELAEVVTRKVVAQVWDLLSDERKDRIRRGHPNMARGFALALEALEKEFLSIKVR